MTTYEMAFVVIVVVDFDVRWQTAPHSTGGQINGCCLLQWLTNLNGDFLKGNYFRNSLATNQLYAEPISPKHKSKPINFDGMVSSCSGEALAVINYVSLLVAQSKPFLTQRRRYDCCPRKAFGRKLTPRLLHSWPRLLVGHLVWSTCGNMLTHVWLRQIKFSPHGVPSLTKPWSGVSPTPVPWPLVALQKQESKEWFKLAGRLCWLNSDFWFSWVKFLSKLL